MTFLKNKKGSVLILAIWTLMFLTIFAVHIGLRLRQRVMVLSNLLDKSELRWIAASGVKKSISALKLDLLTNNLIYTTNGKIYRHNNPRIFGEKIVGNGAYNVTYQYREFPSAEPQERYGLIDEESKLNINTVDRKELERLLQRESVNL